MAFLNFGKKQEAVKEVGCGCSTPEAATKEESCCCGGESKNETESCCCAGSVTKIESVKVLGAGCKSCHEMYENVKKALKSMEIDVEAEYVTDMEKVMTYGIMSMPGLVVNEKVVSVGRVLKPADIEKLIHSLGI